MCVNFRAPCASSILVHLIRLVILSSSSVNVKVNCDLDLAMKLGLGNWWGPSGLISVRLEVESDRNYTETVYTIPIEPWWTEGSFPSHGLTGFAIPSNPANACSPVENPPSWSWDLNFSSDSDLELSSNESEGRLFFLLTQKDTDCDIETKVQNANGSGYAGIIIRNTGSSHPERMDQNFSSYGIYASSIGDSDGLLLQTNFSFPIYSILIEDKRSTYVHDVVEIVVLSLGVVLGLVVLFLICKSIVWCSGRTKDCLARGRVERRVTLLHSTISSLPIRKWARELDTLSEANKMCRICRELFQDDEEIRILPCRHIFHLICVDQWILEDRTYCITCKHILLPPDEHFPPSDVSDSGEFAVVISSETLPLMDPEGYSVTNDEKSKEALAEPQSHNLRIAIPPETFDASFESVLHAPTNWKLRKTGEALQKQESPDSEPVVNRKSSQSVESRRDSSTQRPASLISVKEDEENK